MLILRTVLDCPIFLDMVHVWIHLIFCLDIYLPCTQNSHNNTYCRRNRLSHLLCQGCPRELCCSLCLVAHGNHSVFRLPSSSFLFLCTSVGPSLPLRARSSVWIPSNFVPASHPEPLRSAAGLDIHFSASKLPNQVMPSCASLGRVQLSFLIPAHLPQPL